MTAGTNNKTEISFSSEDIQLFSTASHDKNPLHLSTEYARKTPYAKPVVFGVLGGLACLGQLSIRPGFILSKIVLDFSGPLFTNIPYQVEITDVSPKKATAKIFDGKRILLKMTAKFEAGDLSFLNHDDTHQSPSLKAANLKTENLVVGHAVKGYYSPNLEKFRALIKHLNLEERVGEIQVAALLWSSYLIGMELPGRQALFSKLSLDFDTDWAGSNTPLSYIVEVVDFDTRFNLLRSSVQLAGDGNLLAKGEIRSFVRPDSPTSNIVLINTLLKRSEVFKGKVALVTGASRGLGATIAQALALQGCTVLVNFFKSKAEAERIQKTLADAPGEIVLVQGDASNHAWCEAIKQEIIKDYGRLDFLVCNACPAILPLWLEPNALSRIHSFVSQSLALMSIPMATFLDTLSENSGWNVVISSVVSSNVTPAEWPHYVSAKCAIEGLTRVAAAEYGKVNFLIARPPKLLTDQTNTPLGRQGALSPEQVAVKIVERLTSSERAGCLEILEEFGASI